MNLKMLFITLFASYILYGCGSNKVPMRSENLDWPRADIMPSIQAQAGAKSNVIVRKPDVSAFPQFRQVKLGDVFKRTVSKHINEAGAIVLNRDIPAKYRDEIELYHIKENKQYKGPDIAGYLVDINVVKATESSKFLSGGKGMAARCHITARIEAIATVYKLPEVAQVTVIELEGDAGGKTPAHYRKCQYTYQAQQRFFGNAISRAADDVRVQLQNAFAPVAYISEVKQDSGDYYFKLSSGKSAGIQAEAEAIVYQLEQAGNALNNQVQLEEHPITEVVILDKISTNYAWFMIDDEDLASQILIGDYVKVKYEASMLDDMVKGIYRGVEDYFLPPL